MKFALLGSIAFICAATAFAVQTGSGQTSTEPIRVSGCLQGDGTNESPWILAGAVLPQPPAPAPAAGPGGGRGDGRGGGAGRGDGRGAAGAGAGAGRGDAAGRGADGGRGAGAGRGGDGGRGAQAAAPAPPAPRVNLRLTGVNMTPWRRMYIEVHGTLGSRPASGPQELMVVSARSAQGDCR